MNRSIPDHDTDDPQADSRAYAIVAAAIRYLDAHCGEQPSLAQVAAHVGLSEAHFQRLFVAWAGVSPKQYLQFLTKESAKARLRGVSVLDAALATGLSGSGRLHDLMVNCEGVTPGEYRQGGAGVTIRYGVHESPFGACLVAATERGICKLAFFDDDAERAVLDQELRAEWPAATLLRDDGATAALIPKIFPHPGDRPQPLKVLLRGSVFQLKVWEALLAIPDGEVRTYGDVAGSLGMPDATRAVASAIARNHVGWLIPCHRVIRAGGEFSNYRWGGTRKKAMIAWEASVAARNEPGQDAVTLPDKVR